MAEPLRHRQTKGAATDMPDLRRPRHIPTLPTAAEFRHDEGWTAVDPLRPLLIFGETTQLVMNGH
jgi:hypothetical protein